MKKHLPILRQQPVDHPAETDDSPETRTILRVEGMDCASCATTVERKVAALPGVRQATANFAAGRLDAEHVTDLSRAEIEHAVEAAGYSIPETPSEETSFWLTKRNLSVLVAALLFVLGFVLGFLGVPEALRVMVFLAAVVVGGAQIFRAAFAGIKARHLDMNVLMAAAVIGAVGIGEWAEAALVVVLSPLGTPSSLTRPTGHAARCGRWRITSDEVLVSRMSRRLTFHRAGRRGWSWRDLSGASRRAVGRYGEVIEGSSVVNETPITGEDAPVEKEPGDEVYSGSLNGLGGLLIRATREAENSTLQKISPRRAGAGGEGAHRAVRGPLLPLLHTGRSGRGGWVRRHTAHVWGFLRRMVLSVVGPANYRLPVRVGDLHSSNRGLRNRAGRFYHASWRWTVGTKPRSYCSRRRWNDAPNTRWRTRSCRQQRAKSCQR